MIESGKEVSIILPAYNEGHRLSEVVREAIDTLEEMADEWEIIIVDDGSTDLTPQVAKSLAESDERIKYVRLDKNVGKGFALKKGFELSKGELVAFLDADMDLNPRQLKYYAEIMEREGVDAVIGSKRHPFSKVNYPLKRKVLSNVYFLLVKALFNLNVKDTQVGLKLFKRRVLEEVMPKIQVKRYALDVEILANAVRRGYKVIEAPVELDFKLGSKVNWREICWMLIDTLNIAYKMHVKRSYD